MTPTKLRKLLVIVGSAKAGTTALSDYLALHPQMIRGDEKEPKFFTDFAERSWTGPAIEGLEVSFITDPGAYEANFPRIDEHTWAIDASTDYIWCDSTPALIERFAEHCEVRVVAVVRDPVDRAVSEYNHTLRNNFETLSFAESVEAEPSRYREGWHPLFYHMRRSTVRHDIHRFRDAFGDRFMVLDYAELGNIEPLLKRLYGFLGVVHVPLPPMERKNESYLPRSRLARDILDNERLRSLSRLFVPTSLRRTVWRKLYTNSRNVQTVGRDEREMFRLSMQAEIEECVKDPLIPTDNWSCTHGN